MSRLNYTIIILGLSSLAGLLWWCRWDRFHQKSIVSWTEDFYGFYDSPCTKPSTSQPPPQFQSQQTTNSKSNAPNAQPPGSLSESQSQGSLSESQSSGSLSKSQSPSPPVVPGCRNQDHTSRTCEASKSTGFDNPEIRSQLAVLSKAPSSRDYKPPNSHRLPNLASFYIGARIRLLPNTVDYVCPDCKSVYCKPDLETIIKPAPLVIGESYRFKGNKGGFRIHLPLPALISGFTLIHPLISEVPSGFYNSAPQNFAVYGLRSLDDSAPLLLGRYKYCDHGPRAQSFVVSASCVGSEKHNAVNVEFEENYGGNYTSIYEFEVHGLFSEAVK